MSNPVHQIDIAKQFSDVPAGRYRKDGEFSGAFRDDLLLPALRAPGQLEVLLDGTEGYSSAFLEEAFGGLVRLHHISAAELHDRLRLVTEDRSIEQEIWEYIDHPRDK